MRFTLAQYEMAQESLHAAMTQVEPDGKCCAVCGDNGHMAFECGFNPLVAVYLCREVFKASERLHDVLHWLGGFDCQFGVQVGPATIVMPDGGAECQDQ